MSEKTINEEIEILVNDIANNNPAPEKAKIKLSNQNNIFEKIIHISNIKNYKNQRKKKTK